MYKIMIYINTHSGDKWFYYQENDKDYVAYSLQEIKETVLTLIDTYGKDNIKIVKQVTGEDMEGSVETFIYDSTDNYEELVNRPIINGVEIIGELSLAELGIQPAGDYATNDRVNTLEETVNNIDFSPYATNERVDQVEYKVDNIDLTPYATNERVDQVEAKVDAIDLEPYATMDYLDEVVAGIDFSASNENITGVKTFSVLPRSTVEPTSEDELTNKSYVDHGVEGCASKEYVAQYVDDKIVKLSDTPVILPFHCTERTLVDNMTLNIPGLYNFIKDKFLPAVELYGDNNVYVHLTFDYSGTLDFRSGLYRYSSYRGEKKLYLISAYPGILNVSSLGVSTLTKHMGTIEWDDTKQRAYLRGSSTGLGTNSKLLLTDFDYSTPYEPQYPGSPATKKYVDDAISAAITAALGGEY